MNATSQSRALRSHVAGQPRRLLPLHRADRGITLRQVQAKAWKEVQLPRPHEPKGNIKVKVLEAKGPSKGVALFLHGFGQDPTNYDTVLKGIADSGINVIAPVATRNLGTIINKEKLQTATYKDAKEVIDTMYGNANTGTEQGKTIAQLAANRDTLALAGHSVGGGLALSVVSDFPQQLTHLALMSPFYQLEPAYDPTAAINGKNPDAKPFVAPKNAAVFTGSLDFIALKGQVEKRITDPLRTKVPVASVETDNFGNGTHFGYCNSVSFNGLIIIPNLYNNVAAEALSIRKASEQIAKGKSLLNEKEAGLPRGLWALILKLLEAVGFALAGFLALEAFGVYGTRVEVETKDDLVKLLNKP